MTSAIGHALSSSLMALFSQDPELLNSQPVLVDVGNSDSIGLSDKIRVRQIIASLSYSKLVQQGVIPDLLAVTPQIQTKKYPAWVYAINKQDSDMFSKFGLFMEMLVTTVIQKPTTQFSAEDYVALWQKNFCEPGFPLDPVLINGLTSSRNFFKGILDFFRQAFTQHANVKDQFELNFESVSGHPDLWTPDWILDVKTSSSFKSMQESAFLQILAYGALSRANGYNPSVIGILLPLQRQILYYDIRQWDSSEYLCLLNQHANWVKKDELALDSPRLLRRIKQIEPPNVKIPYYPNILNSIGCIFHRPNIGHHAHKVSEYSKTYPVQIYLSNPKPGEDQGYLSDSDIVYLKEKSEGVHLFVHGILNLNIGHMNGWQLDRIKDQLAVSQKIGARGVVFHVGKAKDVTIEQAWVNMYCNIRDALSSASEECPFILETPAGQGKEMLSVISSFIDFYNLFTPEQKKLFKLCVDTQHVFSAGYDPAWYIQTIITRLPGALKLVHFNDSSVRRGGAHDSHAPPGLGYIGYLRLRKVHKICTEHQIAMVVE